MVARQHDVPARRTRAEAREDTRQRLLDAALEVFLEKGYAASSVEDIAARAGFTRGALYSNFADKDAVFLALVDARMAERVADVTRVMAASSPLTLFADLRTWSDEVDDGDARLRLFAEFRAHALRNESARLRLAERERALRGAYERAIDAQFRAVGVAPPVPVRDLALIVFVLDIALPMQHALDPEDVADGVLFDALTLLFRAGVALAESEGGQPQPG